MIRFKTLDEVYLLPYSKFEIFWKRYQDNIKKSITVDEIRKMVTIFLISINQD